MVSPARSSLRTPAGLLAAGVTALCLGVAGWLFVRYPGVLVSGVANSNPTGHVDFETFWRSTSALLHGQDLYQTGSVLKNLNPPFLSLLLAPFGLLPVMLSYWLFTALSVVLAVGTVLVSARELRLSRRVTVFAVVTLLASSPLHGTLLLGQIYVLLMAGLAGAWLAARRGRPGYAAVPVALVVALKPSLAPLLLVPLCWRGHPARWSSVLIGVSATAGFTLVGVLIAGPASAVDWLRLATGTPAPEFDANASVPGVLARLGAPAVFGWVVTVVVVLGTLWWVRRTHEVGRTPPGVVGSADTVWFAVAAGCLLASPIAWLNYGVLLWPGVLVLLRAGRWWAAVPLLTASIIPVAWANLWQAAPHTPAALIGRSLYCWILLGFWIALSAYSRNPGSEAARAEPGPADVVRPDRREAEADSDVAWSATRAD
jgi:hypothetical protein